MIKRFLARAIDLRDADLGFLDHLLGFPRVSPSLQNPMLSSCSFFATIFSYRFGFLATACAAPLQKQHIADFLEELVLFPWCLYREFF